MSGSNCTRVCSLAALLLGVVGCGTTRTTDTARSATEQLLISHSVDQAVSEMDMSVLAGKKVYFDPQYLDQVVDKGYIISSMRQHLLAHGCLLQEDRNKATYVVEARSGAIGTDRNEVTYGLPHLTVPTILPSLPAASVPEVPVAKRVNRLGVAKLAVFAYNRDTGKPVWQSGVVLKTSTAKDTWFLGAGPYPFGTLYSGTATPNGQQIQVPIDEGEETEPSPGAHIVSVTQSAVWIDSEKSPKANVKGPHVDSQVQQATTHEE